MTECSNNIKSSWQIFNQLDENTAYNTLYTIHNTPYTIVNTDETEPIVVVDKF